MRHRQLGRSGLTVSIAGLGCNNFGASVGGRLDLKKTRALVDAALDSGITLFDTANTYGDRGGRSAVADATSPHQIRADAAGGSGS
jgi:aryl-alcohol dehydrogenase-like predicted oxidoreductase